MKSSSKENKKNKVKFLPRVVFKFKDRIDIPHGSDKEIDDFLLKNQIISLEQMFHNFPNIRMSKLINSIEPYKIEELVQRAKSRDSKYNPPNFFTYFAMDYPEEIYTKKLLAELWANENIQYAYKESGPTNPPTVNAANNRSSKWQGYLNPAPSGIDARFAWDVVGGDGTGNVGFIDIERGWDLDHIDLPDPQIKLLSGHNYDHFSHGTGVLGIILAQDNDTGCVGITPNISINKTGVVSQARPGIGRRDHEADSTDDASIFVFNTSEAIAAAAYSLNFGDVLLLESQISLDIVPPGVQYPCEVESAIFEFIQLATASGIIVIEAAGNGARDLDLFQNSSGRFVLNRNKAGEFSDSGAIMVGSASSAVPHTWDGSSNFGSRIDCYSWGENIKTTGNGSAPLGHYRTGYTSSFDGTSGASAIIAGAVISIQSMREAKVNSRYSPEQVREILRKQSNGTNSANPATDNIGVMPDLKKIKENEIGTL